MPFGSILRPAESWQERWISTPVKNEKDAESEVMMNGKPTAKISDKLFFFLLPLRVLPVDEVLAGMLCLPNNFVSGFLLPLVEWRRR